jgi:L,D-transpeptidase YcbB
MIKRISTNEKFKRGIMDLSKKVFPSLVLLLGYLIMPGCSSQKSKTKAIAIVSDSTIYSKQNFTDAVLTDAEISSFFNTVSVYDSIKNQVIQFYVSRQYQLAWFNKEGINSGATVFYSQLQNYSSDFADSSLHNSKLDTLLEAVESDEKQFLADDKKMLQLELLLTTTFFKYAQKAYGGTAKNVTDLEWFIPRKKKNYQALLDSLVSLSAGDKLKEPVNEYYLRLKEKLQQYRDIQKKGGFPFVDTAKKIIREGDNDISVQSLKKILLISGDLKTNDSSLIYTALLTDAVIKFQNRMGLNATGKIDKATITELNKPVAFRIKQIMINMERLRWVPAEIEKNYVLVNIPEYALHIFENGKPVWKTNVVVGKAFTQTAIFKGNIAQIILNPYWNVPNSILQKEILPALRRNPNYLQNNNMEMVDGRVRQKSGINNALGKIKFLFPNSYSIYLHDTPAKSLFGETKRAFSHGCIRVDNPDQLALYILKNDSSWALNKIDSIQATGNEFKIQVKPALPVYITYFTAWVNSNGELNFRNDLYNLDEKLSKEIFGE